MPTPDEAVRTMRDADAVGRASPEWLTLHALDTGIEPPTPDEWCDAILSTATELD